MTYERCLRLEAVIALYREAYEATEDIKTFMIMPQEAWGDRWEYENVFRVAKERYNKAKQALTIKAVEKE